MKIGDEGQRLFMKINVNAMLKLRIKSDKKARYFDFEFQLTDRMKGVVHGD